MSKKLGPILQVGETLVSQIQQNRPQPKFDKEAEVVVQKKESQSNYIVQTERSEEAT